MEDETTESAEMTLNIKVHVNEDDDTTARYILAEQLEKIAGSVRDGFRSAGRVMHPNGHQIGTWELS